MGIPNLQPLDLKPDALYHCAAKSEPLSHKFTLCKLVVILHAFSLPANFIKINVFDIFYFRYTKVSNSLDADQAGQNVRPDLDSDCFHRLLADDAAKDPWVIINAHYLYIVYCI